MCAVAFGLRAGGKPLLFIVPLALSVSAILVASGLTHSARKDIAILLAEVITFSKQKNGGLAGAFCSCS